MIATLLAIFAQFCSAVMAERTFIMVKPDGVHRGIVGEIIKRFEQKGFKLVAMKFAMASKDLLQKHYSALSSKPFFNDLVDYMSSGPVVPMVSEEHLKKHYADLSDKPFFPKLIKYMASGPVVPMVWEGKNVVKTGRIMLGETNPFDSLPGTIRGDFCIEVGRNICHGSDSVKSAEKEIALWFKEDELVNWKPCTDAWVYE